MGTEKESTHLKPKQINRIVHIDTVVNRLTLCATNDLLSRSDRKETEARENKVNKKSVKWIEIQYYCQLQIIGLNQWIFILWIITLVWAWEWLHWSEATDKRARSRIDWKRFLLKNIRIFTLLILNASLNGFFIIVNLCSESSIYELQTNIYVMTGNQWIVEASVELKL